jgi:opacity protein-like surface antigen
MTRSIINITLISLTALGLATPAWAQDDGEKGIYAVARAGASIGPESKLDLDKVPSSTTFDEKTKYKTGITGEIGGGYDFGMFRVEQTIGYTSNNLNVKDSDTGSLVGAGRSRAFNMTVSGYVDIPVSKMIIPYVGGGVGVSRVDADLSRVNSTTGIGSSYSGKDWGMTFHADAGIGVRVAPKTTIEIGGRYSQTSGLKFNGQSDGVATSYEPKLRSLTGTLGVRYAF